MSPPTISQNSQNSLPSITYAASDLLEVPGRYRFKLPLENRYFTRAIVKSTSKRGHLPTFVAYDALRTQNTGKESYVRLKCFYHSYDCQGNNKKSLANVDSIMHGNEYCYLVTGTVDVAPNLFQVGPFTSSTRDTHNLVYLSELGEGGCGQVYLAHDLTQSTTDKLVYSAVKVQKAVDTRALYRILMEIRFHTRMSHHPNAVTLYRVFAEGDYYVMVMELMAGDLEALLMEDRSALVNNKPLLGHIIKQVVDFIQYMHDNGIFHRCVLLSLFTASFTDICPLSSDIKPSNIFLKPDGRTVCMGDFGFTTSHVYTPSGRSCGTQPYMSPETFKAVGISNATNDLWALTVTIAFLVLGDEPWERAIRNYPEFRKYNFHDWDRNYDDFYHDRFILQERFPISWKFAAFLRKGLNPRIEGRTTLEEMKSDLAGIKYFWLTNAELVDAPPRAVNYALMIGLADEPSGSGSNDHHESSASFDSVQFEGTTVVNSSSPRISQLSFTSLERALIYKYKVDNGLDASSDHPMKKVDKGKGKMVIPEPPVAMDIPNPIMEEIAVGAEATSESDFVIPSLTDEAPFTASDSPISDAYGYPPGLSPTPPPLPPRPHNPFPPPRPPRSPLRNQYLTLPHQNISNPFASPASSSDGPIGPDTPEQLPIDFLSPLPKRGYTHSPLSKSISVSLSSPSSSGSALSLSDPSFAHIDFGDDSDDGDSNSDIPSIQTQMSSRLPDLPTASRGGMAGRQILEVGRTDIEPRVMDNLSPRGLNLHLESPVLDRTDGSPGSLTSVSFEAAKAGLKTNQLDYLDAKYGVRAHYPRTSSGDAFTTEGADGGMRGGGIFAGIQVKVERLVVTNPDPGPFSDSDA